MLAKRLALISITLSSLFIVDNVALAADKVGYKTKVYIQLPGRDEMAVADLSSNEIITIMKVGHRPHGIAATGDGRTLWINGEYDGYLYKIDTVKDTVLGRYPIGRRSNELEVTADGRFVYQAMLYEGTYKVFDTVKNEIVKIIDVPGLPHNVVRSPDDKFMYLAPLDYGTPEQIIAEDMPRDNVNNDKVYVLDTSTNEVVAAIPTEFSSPRPIAISPDGNRLYACVDGLLGFVVMDVRPAVRKVIYKVEFPLTAEEKANPSRCHGAAVRPDGKEVYLASVDHGIVYAYDITKQNAPPKLAARIALPDKSMPEWLSISSDSKTVVATASIEDGGDDVVRQVLDERPSTFPREVRRERVPVVPRR